jgi:acetolactate synthase-1/2/3 large subunit
MSPYLKDADLVLVIDASSWPPWYPPASIRKTTRAKIVFMDPDPLQLKYPVYGYPSDLLIQADSSVALPQLIELLEKKRIDESKVKDRADRWAKEHRRIREELHRKALDAKDAYPIDPRWLCQCIDEAIDEDTIIVNETITHGGLIHAAIERNRVVSGTRYEATGPVAHTGLGQGLGIALGVKLAEPGKTVMALVGDGTFNYNPVLAAYGAAQEYGIPFMTVIFNNGCYAAMQGHARYYPEGFSVKHGTYYGVGCGPSPDYCGVAEAFGGYGERVEDPSEVKASLMRALRAVGEGRPALLDVVLSPTTPP